MTIGNKSNYYRKIGIALIVSGIVALVASVTEYFTFSSYCTGTLYCQSLYTIPEFEIGIFGIVLTGFGLFFFFHRG